MTARLVTCALLACAIPLASQSRSPVVWKVSVEPGAAPAGSSVLAHITATLESGWHIYALSTPEGGPSPTTIKLSPEASAASGLKLWQPRPETKFDENFKLTVEAFEHEVTFLAAIEIGKSTAAGKAEIPLLLRYQACTDKQCLPKRTTLTAAFTVDPKAVAAPPAIPANYLAWTGAAKPGAQSPASSASAGSRDQGSGGLGAFLLVAFGFGLAAIFTPCVFPMIPITLSFFLNRPGITRSESLRQALLFCLGIVVLFTGIGLTVTALVGPFGVVQLGSNPWVNAFIAVVIVGFGLSLLGAYEITLPSGLLTKMDQASQRGGTLGTLLMGLTFCLTSFACVGPFVGPLLASSVGRGGLEPALGMMSFASGLASPFFFLAMFPAFLQKLPRSGGWLARVKIVFGFVLLAVSLKYISAIDQVLQWNVLTRERFLAAWLVLFALPGLYLLGFLRLEGVRQEETTGIGRVLTGAAFLIFAFSLLPGMFGSPLGELDSWVPLAAESRNGVATGAKGLTWTRNDFDGALASAKTSNKLVLVAFTGYACTNCHWMKANMFTRREVAELMQNFVLAELYTDGTDATSEKNQKLQESKFSTVAIPYYAIFDATGRVVSTFPGLTRSVPEYLAFLRSAPGTQTAQASLIR